MSSPFPAAVAIDTNVFRHFVNKSENSDGHITEILDHFQAHGTQLIIDDRGRILAEYRHHIPSAFKSAFVKGFEINKLRYWLRLIIDRHNLAEIKVRGDSLMSAIRDLVYEDDAAVDRIFVYVAFKTQAVLVSNDCRNIVVGTTGERGNPRRRRLLRVARRERLRGVDILTSRMAHAKIQT